MTLSPDSPGACASGLYGFLPAVEQLLRQHIGLDPATVGSDRIAQAVAARLASRERAEPGQDVFAYLRLLLDSEEELRALVDEVVVPETWFFRDRQAFRCLRRQASRERPRPEQTFRVLSVPCCTGEEPYSIAMLLLDAGLGDGGFEVVAVDVSQAALATAAAGSYADLSFRETDPEFVALRDHYCRREGQRNLVAAEVRGAVRFLQASLTVPQFLEGQPRFHAIFCRNLFIYLDEPARRTALANLRRLLLPGGALYFSAVEAGAFLDPGFRRLGDEFPFAFTAVAASRRAGDVSSPVTVTGGLTSPARQPNLPARPAKPQNGTPKQGQPTVVHHPAHPLRGARAGGSADTLTKARQAADTGRLEEAATLCAELAAKGPPQVEVFYLLGVVRQAQGDFAEAERCLQRALYLNPRHVEALRHMALLARRRGDERLAQNFLRRAGRTDNAGAG